MIKLTTWWLALSKYWWIKKALMLHSENKCVCTFFFFFGDLLEILINDRNCQKDTRTRANCSHEICKDGQSADTAATKGSSGWDVSVEVLHHRVLSLTFNHEFLIHELSSNVSWAWSRNINPNSWEESARGQYEDSVNNGVNRILLNIIETLWGADIVSKTTDWGLMASHIIVLPLAKETNKDVSSELSGEDLSEEVNVWNESSLKDNWNVWSVEKFDWVWLLESSHFSTG